MANVVKGVSKEEGSRLADAVEKIHELDPGIHEGPYVQVPSDGSLKLNSDGTVTFTLKVPDDLKADGRTYYLIGVDKDGKIHILQNESLEDGTITVTGDPDMTYQIVYEDGGAQLAGMVGENGTLVSADGKEVKVSTNHCFWHWIILLLALIGAALEIIFRKKRKTAVAIAGADAVLMVLCCIPGWCVWDIVMTVIGIILSVGCLCIGRKQRKQEEQESTQE